MKTPVAINSNGIIEPIMGNPSLVKSQGFGFSSLSVDPVGYLILQSKASLSSDEGLPLVLSVFDEIPAEYDGHLGVEFIAIKDFLSHSSVAEYIVTVNGQDYASYMSDHCGALVGLDDALLSQNPPVADS